MRKLLWIAVFGVAALGLAVFLAGRGPSRRSAAGEPDASEDQPASELEWERPRFTARAGERRALVSRHIQGLGLADAAVLEAMRQVPRHEFVPPSAVRRAYDDCPLSIGCGQTISQPYIVAYMTAALELQPGHKVLEIGTGSGYQAAVLSELTPHVYTIEIIRALGDEAKKRLERLGYKTAQCKVADGYHGWPEHGPFDAIIVTCAAGSVPPPLIKQLKPGGRMCIPVGPPGHTQQLILVTKDAEGKVRSKSLMAVVFVPLTRELR